MGGDGGGRLRIDAQTVILDGTIRANGTNGVSGCCAGGGSGGSIRLDVGTLSGGGSISANGGASSSSTNSGGGGGGRVALRYDDATGFDLSLVEARGGAGLNDGGAGTVFLKDPIQLIGDLKVIDGGSDTPLLADVTVDRFDITDARVVGNAIDTNTLEIQSSVLIINDIRAGSLRVTSSSVINATQTTTTTESALVIDADTLEVDATSSIDVSGAGYLGAHSGGNGSSNGRTLGNASGSTRRNGGSHAGLGGAGTAPATPNAVYGDFQDPSDLGSGGGSDLGVGGDGGGRLRIDAQTVILDGTIRANGTNGVSGCCAGGGSGGSIRLDVGTLSGGGSISANGGASSSSTNSGGGGGGRVALRYDDATGFDLSLVEARGGAGLNDGGAGTVFLKDNAQPLGALRLDNESFVQPQPTPLHSLGQGQSTALTPTTLTDAAASFVPGALRGLELNPNLNQSATFTILDNDATTISIDPLDGDMTAVAAANDSYSGEIVVDTLLIDGRALVTLLDGNAAHTDRTATITATELRIRGSSSLTHPDATTSQQFGLRLRVLDTLEVDSTSSIDVSGAGYLGAFSGGNGSSNGRTLGNASRLLKNSRRNCPEKGVTEIK